MHRTRLRSTDRLAAGYDGERHLLVKKGGYRYRRIH